MFCLEDAQPIPKCVDRNGLFQWQRNNHLHVYPARKYFVFPNRSEIWIRLRRYLQYSSPLRKPVQITKEDVPRLELLLNVAPPRVPKPSDRPSRLEKFSPRSFTEGLDPIGLLLDAIVTHIFKQLFPGCSAFLWKQEPRARSVRFCYNPSSRYAVQSVGGIWGNLQAGGKGLELYPTSHGFARVQPIHGLPGLFSLAPKPSAKQPHAFHAPPLWRLPLSMHYVRYCVFAIFNMRLAGRESIRFFGHIVDDFCA